MTQPSCFGRWAYVALVRRIRYNIEKDSSKSTCTEIETECSFC